MPSQYVWKKCESLQCPLRGRRVIAEFQKSLVVGGQHMNTICEFRHQATGDQNARILQSVAPETAQALHNWALLSRKRT